MLVGRQPLLECGGLAKTQYGEELEEEAELQAAVDLAVLELAVDRVDEGREQEVREALEYNLLLREGHALGRAFALPNLSTPCMQCVERMFQQAARDRKKQKAGKNSQGTRYRGGVAANNQHALRHQRRTLASTKLRWNAATGRAKQVNSNLAHHSSQLVKELSRVTRNRCARPLLSCPERSGKVGQVVGMEQRIGDRLIQRTAECVLRKPL